jgi:hypothetical protein
MKIIIVLALICICFTSCTTPNRQGGESMSNSEAATTKSSPEVANNADYLYQEFKENMDIDWEERAMKSAQTLASVGVKEIVQMEYEKVEEDEFIIYYLVRIIDNKEKKYKFTLTRWGLGQIRNDNGKVLWMPLPE